MTSLSPWVPVAIVAGALALAALSIPSPLDLAARQVARWRLRRAWPHLAARRERHLRETPADHLAGTPPVLRLPDRSQSLQWQPSPDVRLLRRDEYAGISRHAPQHDEYTDAYDPEPLVPLPPADGGLPGGLPGEAERTGQLAALRTLCHCGGDHIGDCDLSILARRLRAGGHTEDTLHFQRTMAEARRALSLPGAPPVTSSTQHFILAPGERISFPVPDILADYSPDEAADRVRAAYDRAEELAGQRLDEAAALSRQIWKAQHGSQPAGD